MQYFIIGIFGVMIVISIVYNIMYLKKVKDNEKKYREENPDTATIQLYSSTNIVSKNTYIYEIDEKTPIYSSKGIKQFVFINEGEHILSVGASSTRPGVLYKSVTTDIGPTDIKVKIEKKKNYILKYSKNNDFYLEEIEKNKTSK